MSESLNMHLDTDIGWCRVTPANESADPHGQSFALPEGEADPRAPLVREPDHKDVLKLRHHLKQHAGLPGLDICAPDELERIARVFYRDGFVVVRDLLDPMALKSWREGCAEVLGELLDKPGTDGRKYQTETNRLPHRYSYGTSSGSRHLLHDLRWADKVDIPTTTPILQRLFGDAGYHVLGAGGDVCLPGAVEYQALHIDFPYTDSVSQARLAQANGTGLSLRYDNAELDPGSLQLALQRTPPIITINFLMSGLTCENGPIRHIPGSHMLRSRPPNQLEEPEWMRLATLVGAPAGAGVFRDSRAWHGATPNVSQQIRAMPNVEYQAAWMNTESLQTAMPHEVWQQLSPHARNICQHIVAEPGQWPVGAGFMHPLAANRATLES